MKCENCNSEENSINDRLGERVCDDCGYVMVSSMYESTTEKGFMESSRGIGGRGHNFGNVEPDNGVLGSIIKAGSKDSQGRTINTRNAGRLIRTAKFSKGTSEKSISNGVMECIFVASPWLPNANLKERINTYYKQLYLAHQLTGYSYPVRAVAIVLYILRENGIPISLKELSKSNEVNPARVSKCARKIAKSLGKPWLLHKMPVQPWADKTCSDLKVSDSLRTDYKTVVQFLEQAVEAHDMTFTNTFMASGLWFTCLLRKTTGKTELTQREIAKQFNCSEVSVRNTQNKLFAITNVDKNTLTKMTIDEYVSGVRYG